MPRAMKNPALEKHLQHIEQDETKRRKRSAQFAAKKRSMESKSRKAVMKRMMKTARQNMYAQRREIRRPTFGTGLARDRLIRPQL